MAAATFTQVNCAWSQSITKLGNGRKIRLRHFNSVQCHPNAFSRLRLLKNSAGGSVRICVDFIFRRVDGSRGYLYDSMRFQDEDLGSFAGPFGSKVYEANQWARKFVPCVNKGVFQHPRLKPDARHSRFGARFSLVTSIG